MFKLLIKDNKRWYVETAAITAIEYVRDDCTRVHVGGINAATFYVEGSLEITHAYLMSTDERITL